MKIKGKVDYLLAGIIVLSLFLNFYLLNHAGSNEYYTVAVKSMMKNFHNFFYASFDPAGFITVDKPPVALWIQTLSASVFGLSNFSVLLPEALAGVISVILMYVIVKPQFGRAAALVSSLTLALTPVFVAVVRTNNVDSILILTLLIAAWALMRAVAKKKVRWLIVSVILVGIGFNVKMLEAFMILPAIYVFYWIAMKTSWKKKILHLGTATIILAAVSLSWAVTVDLVPKSERPYIGSSQTNSVLELAFGYNGISRLTGQQGSGAGFGKGKMPQAEGEGGSAGQGMPQMNGGESPGQAAAVNGRPQMGSSGGNGGQWMQRTGRGGQMGGMFGTGQAGPLRLFSKALSGQASWLLPFVLFGVIGLVLTYIRGRKLTMRHKFAIFWLVWLIPLMVFFSVAGFFHQYYLSLMGPPIAALAGIGGVVIWDFYRDKNKDWAGWLLPSAVLSTLLFAALILHENSISSTWVYLTIVAGVVLFAAGLVLRTENRQRFKSYFAIAGLAAMLIAPLCWTLPSTFNQTNSSIPVAGPKSTLSGAMGGGNFSKMRMGGSRQEGFPSGASRAVNGQFNGGRPGTGQFEGGGQSGTNQRAGGMTGDELNTKLLKYLEKHYQGEKFLLAVQRAQSAYGIMLKTNYAVMAMGGFGGSDPAINAQKLAKMAKAGEVKYFLISGGQMGNQSQSATQWIEKHCKKVPAKDWSNTGSTSGQSGMGGFGQSTLYVYKG